MDKIDVSRLRYLIEKNNIQYIDFAEKIGITKAGLYRMFSTGSTKGTTVNKMAELLGVTPSSLYEGKELTVAEPSIGYKKRAVIQYIPVHAQAGFFSGFSQETPVYAQFHLPEMPDGEYFAFTVSGESMAPTIRSGDIVVCLKLTDATEVKPNAVHVLFDKTEGLVVKRLEVKGKKIRCVSDNEDYPAYDIEAASVKDIYRVRRVITSNI